jgi:hypothetical protein
VAEKNQSDHRSVMSLAREKNLGVLLNRPLNAIVGQDLVRLADFAVAEFPVSDEKILAEIDALIALEREFFLTHLEEFADDEEAKRALREFISVGSTMQRYWGTFGSIEQYNDVLTQYFAPRLAFCAQYLRERGIQEYIDWYAGYLSRARALLHAVGAHYARPAQDRANRFRSIITGVVGPHAAGSLASLAIRLLIGVEGVDAALVGMRREEYVDDVLEALRQGPLGSDEVVKRLGIELRSALEPGE